MINCTFLTKLVNHIDFASTELMVTHCPQCGLKHDMYFFFQSIAFIYISAYESHHQLLRKICFSLNLECVLGYLAC